MKNTLTKSTNRSARALLCCARCYHGSFLHVDLYNGKSKWVTQKEFELYTVGDEYDGHDSKGYYMTYKLEDGKTEKEYYDWKDNWEEIKRTPTHTVYKGEECMLIDFTNKRLGGPRYKASC